MISKKRKVTRNSWMTSCIEWFQHSTELLTLKEKVSKIIMIILKMIMIMIKMIMIIQNNTYRISGAAVLSDGIYEPQHHGHQDGSNNIFSD